MKLFVFFGLTLIGSLAYTSTNRAEINQSCANYLLSASPHSEIITKGVCFDKERNEIIHKTEDGFLRVYQVPTTEVTSPCDVIDESGNVRQRRLTDGACGAPSPSYFNGVNTVSATRASTTCTRPENGTPELPIIFVGDDSFLSVALEHEIQQIHKLIKKDRRKGTIRAERLRNVCEGSTLDVWLGKNSTTVTRIVSSSASATSVSANSSYYNYNPTTRSID